MPLRATRGELPGEGLAYGRPGDYFVADHARAFGASVGPLPGSITIAHNPRLATLFGLEAITAVGRDIRGKSLRVWSNPTLCLNEADRARLFELGATGGGVGGIMGQGAYNVVLISIDRCRPRAVLPSYHPEIAPLPRTPVRLRPR